RRPHLHPCRVARVIVVLMGWPDLATPGWKETCDTLHLWSQIVGKLRLALAPMQNHWWHVPLYVTPTGLSTSVIQEGGRAFEVELDFVHHELRARDAAGHAPSFPLAPMSVAEFYRRTRDLLRSIGVEPHILARPVEVVEAIPFEKDEAHRSYDRDW